jgi:DNA-binding transcriptional LysR family regulator
MGPDVQLSDRIGRRLKLQDLHILMTVVQTGSMGKAARLLNTGQPAISRAVAELEHTMGVRLLDRGSQGAVPTPYGRALLSCGAAVFDDLRRGVKDIEFLADPTAGEVRVGCNPFLAAGYVSTIVDRLSRRYPRMVFHVITGQSQALQRELTERNVDFLIAIAVDRIADAPLEFETLYEDRVVIATGVRSPWSRRRGVVLSDLANERWVLLSPESVITARLYEAFRAKGLDPPRATVHVVPPEVRISLLTTGRFLSVFPASALKFLSRRSEVKILPVDLATASVPVEAITLSKRTLSPVAQLFIQSARDVAKPLKTV